MPPPASVPRHRVFTAAIPLSTSGPCVPPTDGRPTKPRDKVSTRFGYTQLHDSWPYQVPDPVAASSDIVNLAEGKGRRERNKLYRRGIDVRALYADSDEQSEADPADDAKEVTGVLQDLRRDQEVCSPFQSLV